MWYAIRASLKSRRSFYARFCRHREVAFFMLSIHSFIYIYIYLYVHFQFFLSIYLCLSEKNYNIFTKSYVLNPNSLDGKGKTCYILTIINKLEYFIVCVWFCVSRIIFQMFGFLVFVGKIEINKI